jgi:hypothetical protein
MKFLGLLCLLLVISEESAAGPLHKPRWYKDQQATPHKWKDKKFVIGWLVVAGTIGADAYSTSRGIGMGLHEKNDLLGTQPSNQKIAGISLLNFGIQTGLHAAAWQVEHDDSSAFWRFLCYTGIPGGVLAVSGRNAIINFKYEADHGRLPPPNTILAEQLAEARAGVLR